MHMLASPKVWTVEEVLALPEDGRRYELVDGVLLVNGVAVPGGDLESLDPAMTPSPSWTHQDAVLELAHLVATYVKHHRIGHTLFAPADVPLQRGQLVQPDIFVVPLTAAGKRPREWAEVGRLLLAVEVLSPSTARSDKVRKRALYQRAGVPQYWIVDIDARIIERWTPESDRAEAASASIGWLPDGASEPLLIDLAAYFTSVTGSAAD